MYDITLTEDQALEMYDQAIDEAGSVIISEVEFDRSRILHELDPVAYWTGFSDFVDSLDEPVEGYTEE